MNLTVLCYHSVQENPRSYGINLEKFKEHVEFVSENYNVLTMTEAFERFQKSELSEDTVVFTFDDGLKTALDAADILESHGARGTFYVISGLLGELHEGQRVLETSEVKELHDSGHEIGSHTVSHRHLTHYRSKHVGNEVIESKSVLEDLIGEEITSFSYPYGDYNDEVVEEVGKADYKNAVTIDMSSINSSDDCLELPRHVVYDWHDRSHVKKMIEGNNIFKQVYWQYPFSNKSRMIRKIKNVFL